MPIKYDYILIPLDLIQYAFKRRLIKLLRIYAYLHLNTYDGHFPSDKKTITDIARALGYKDEEHFNYLLKQLINHNWLGLNKKIGRYHLRSINYMHKEAYYKKRQAVLTYIEDLEFFNVFAFAAIVGYLAKQGSRRRRGLTIRSSLQRRFPRSRFFPVSGQIIEKVLGRSASTISDLKREAVKAGYLEIRKDYDELGLCAKHIKSLRKHMPEIGHRMVIYNSSVALQKPDLVKCNMIFRCRKKPKHSTMESEYY